ncbi:phage major tail tube protein [Polycladidibacter hongkongensis]|uniref:phage major tail tube protein n=1 Tax=Polycladidibacter hongkongensis TaxID=1647556 RepID=UPI00082B6E61|nr:phage major tail tube protein [Pseudovibrio hongkongensis]
MQQPLNIVGDIDLRRKDAPEISRANILTKLHIPSPKFKTVSHAPGGGRGSVDFIMPRLEALEPKAEIKGEDPDLRKMFGEPTAWTFAASMRVFPENRWVSYRGEIYGAIAEFEGDEMTGEELAGFNLVFKEVSRLVVQRDDEELFYWDYWERELRPSSMAQASKRALGI